MTPTRVPAPIHTPLNPALTRRGLLSAGVSAAALGLISACGGGSDKASSTAASAAATAKAGAADLTVWVAREQYLPTDNFLASFKELYPDITIKAELQPDDALFNQLQRMAAADQKLPDLVQVDSYYAAPMFETGVSQDLTTLTDRWAKEDPELFDLMANAALTKDGDRVVGWATTGTTDVIYYRADMLRDAGVNVPFASWDEVLDANRAVKEQNPDIYPWSMIGTRGEGVNWLFTQMLASSVPFDGVTPDLTSDAGMYVIDFYQTLIREGLATTESLAWGEDESRGAWIGGRAAMTLDSIRSSNDLGNAIQDGLGIQFRDDWAVVLPPVSTTGSGDEGSHSVQARTFHVTTSCEHPYEASLVVRHMMETDQAVDAAKDGALALQTEVLADPDFRDAFPYLDDSTLVALTDGTSFPASSAFFAVVEVLERTVQDVLSNPDADPSDLASKWQAELDEASQA